MFILFAGRARRQIVLQPCFEMRILFTQRELRHHCGTELFTIEVAKELRRRGHEVVVFCPRIGDLAQILLNSGVPVKSKLAEIPWEPEVIHGQHHLQAIAAITYFWRTPAIFYCHGSPWVEMPPDHPRITKYVVMCKWMELRMSSEFGIPEAKVCTIPNFVNTDRFSRVRKPQSRPTRALLFGNTFLPPKILAKLESSCCHAGISLEKMGAGYGTSQPRPEMFLPDFDLVFGTGKCAFEAIACGCAVITLLPGLGGQLVTPQNLEQWVYSNFGPRYYTSGNAIEKEWLERELSNYAAGSIVELTETVRRDYNLSAAVDRLEVLYRKAVEEPPPTVSDGRDVAPYLEKMTQEVDLMWAENARLESLNEKCRELESANKILRRRCDIAENYLRKRFIGRWFLKKIQARQERSISS